MSAADYLSSLDFSSDGRFFHSPDKTEESPNQAKEEHVHSADETKAEVWTCSMHPQIRMDKPGKCPICAMDLILLNSNAASQADPMAIHLTKEAAQLANVQTSVVSRENPEKEVRLYGKVQADRTFAAKPSGAYLRKG